MIFYLCLSWCSLSALRQAATIGGDPALCVPAPVLNPDTELLLAAQDGRLADVKYWLRAGAAVDAVDSEYGVSALMLAAEQGHIAVVDHLITLGAKVNLKDGEGQTALMRAAIFDCGGVVSRLLAVTDIDIHATCKAGLTAQEYAWGREHLEIAYMLGAQVVGTQATVPCWDSWL